MEDEIHWRKAGFQRDFTKWHLGIKCQAIVSETVQQAAIKAKGWSEPFGLIMETPK